MNKWQIICPVTAMVVVVAVLLMRQARLDHEYYIMAQTRMIGEELCRSGNSLRLVMVPPALSNWVIGRAGVLDVLSGDERPPVGNSTACTRLVLSNASGSRIAIRLRQDANPEQFYVLGFWTTRESDVPANHRQSARSETNQTPTPGGSGR